MTQLREGDKAPEIKGMDQTGEAITFDQFQNKKIILYFYPRDNTPGCTSEACNLRDNYQELKEMGFEIVGVSPDSQESHEKFVNKNNLPFRLIADPDKEIINSYGVWGEKKMYGKVFEGLHRTTFIISKDRHIEKIIKKVKTKDHAQQIKEKLEK
jgi:peroxiredoxin Q/BCP